VALEARGLTKSFRGRKIVDEVSLNVERGKITGLLGPNGAGKTTIFHMIIGMTRPDRGVVLFDGKDLTHLPMYQRARMGMGYLPQESSVFRKLTVEQNILVILEILGLSGEERRRRAKALMEELQILSIKDVKGFSLSGGERRRVEITRALAVSPEFLLLDEPFLGIDPITVTDLQSIISRLREKGIGILVTDHSVRETLEITDWAYILHEGQIIESGPPQTIMVSKKARETYLGEKFTIFK